MATVYPVNLVLDGRRCLVVGGGAVAERKIDGLVAAGAIVHVVAPEIARPIKDRGDVTWEERPYRTGELADYRLVISATDDATVSAQVFAEGEGAGIWVNSADDPARCSFMLPAIARRGPITVAVGTGGQSPALASWLRDRLAASLGPEHETLADLLAEARSELRADGRSTEGLGWQAALASDMLDLIRAGQIDEARERLRACLSSS